MRQDDERSLGLPWWTWVMPLPILHLCTWGSLRFVVSPGLPVLCLTGAVGIALVHWWGPRVLLGVYLNAALAAPLWGLSPAWAPLFGLPETLGVYLSWLLFRRVTKGQCWLPNRRQTVSFLTLGIWVPVTFGVFAAQSLAAIRDPMEWTAWWTATWSRWIFAIFGTLAITVPLLIFLTGWLQRRGWADLAGRVPPLRLLSRKRRGRGALAALVPLFLLVLLWSWFFPIHPFWFLYGTIILVTALYYGAAVAVLSTSWTTFVLLVVPVLAEGRVDAVWLAGTGGFELALDLMVLCFVGLIVGRTVSDSEKEIEDRAVTEAQLRESRRRYRNIFATAPVAIWEEDFTAVREELRALRRNGVRDLRSYLELHPDYVRRLGAMARVADVNEAGVRMYGADSKEQLIGSLDRILSASSQESFREALVAVAEGTTHFERRVVHRTLQGETIEGLLLASIAPPEAPECHVLACVADVTALERAEEERKRLATAIDQSGDGVIITDTKGGILYVNPAFTRITGYPREEAVGKTPRILKSGRHPPAFYRAMWCTIARGELWAGRLTNRKRDGSLFQAEASISPIRDAEGRIVSYVAVQRDVSREVELEVQLRHSQKMEAVGQLAGGISHDFNNLLTAILGNVQLLNEHILRQEDVKPESLSNGLKEIESAAVRAATLTRQLLAFSRRQVSRPAVLSPNQIVADLDTMVRRLLPESIRFRVELQESAGFIRADAGQIEQVVINLVVNARDAMPDGGELTITMSNLEIGEDETGDLDGPKPGRYVRIAVRDTGVGIPADELERVFEPFYTTKPVGEGTGLGLSTVHGIVTQAGGRVRVRSRPGHGATFEVDFPRVEGLPEPADTPRLRSSDLGGDETIVVCEDEAGVRDLICTALRRQGFCVLPAERAREALEHGATHEGPIHLLLTDVIMPEMNGRQLAESFAKIRPKTQVLYVSGYPDTVISDRGILDDGVELLAKPFTPTSLLLRVRDILDSADGES